MDLVDVSEKLRIHANRRLGNRKVVLNDVSGLGQIFSELVDALLLKKIQVSRLNCGCQFFLTGSFGPKNALHGCARFGSISFYNKIVYDYYQTTKNASQVRSTLKITIGYCSTAVRWDFLDKLSARVCGFRRCHDECLTAPTRFKRVPN